MSFTRNELSVLMTGLNTLARQSDDTIGTAAQLLPLRRKLEQHAADLMQEETPDNGDADDSDRG